MAYTSADREFGDQTIELEMRTGDYSGAVKEKLGYVPHTVVNLADSDFTGTVQSAAADICNFTKAVQELTTNQYFKTNVYVKLELWGE